MAKSKETTVITNIDPDNLNHLTEQDKEQLVRKLLSSLGVTKEIEILSERRDQAAAKLDAERERISAEIDLCRQQIAPLNERIKVLMAELRGLGLKPVAGESGRTRTVSECAGCGAKAHHVEGENATRCAVYADLMEAKSKDQKLTSEMRQKYAERASVVRSRIQQAA
jgi:hypothetical protein